MLMAAAVATVAGCVMLVVPDKIQLTMIGVPLALIIALLILRNPLVGIYAFFLYSILQPQYFIRALEPLKITLMIEVLTLISWVLSLIMNRRSPKWSPFHTWFTIFVGVIGATVFTAANNYYALMSFQAMVVAYVMFVIAADIVDTPKRLRALIWMMLLIHAFFAVRGILTFLSGTSQGYMGPTSGVVGSMFADENEFAMAINMMIPFCLFGLFWLKGFGRTVSGIMLIIFVMAVVASFSRGGLVGLIAVVLFVISISRRKVLTLGIAILMAAVMLVFAPSSYWQKAGTTTEVHAGTANERVMYWLAGFRMFAANPVIGVGADNGKVQMLKFYQGRVDPNTTYGRTFHGTWPQVLAELGLAGGVPYFLMMMFAFRYLWRVRKESLDGTDPVSLYLSSSLIGSLIAYVGCATFLSTAYYPYLWTTYTLIMILVFCRNKAHEQEPIPAKDGSATTTNLGAVATEGLE
jgi:probable O-glycosylation ligase (exosortase A-associated)